MRCALDSMSGPRALQCTEGCMKRFSHWYVGAHSSRLYWLDAPRDRSRRLVTDRRTGGFPVRDGLLLGVKAESRLRRRGRVTGTALGDGDVAVLRPAAQLPFRVAPRARRCQPPPSTTRSHCCDIRSTWPARSGAPGTAERGRRRRTRAARPPSYLCELDRAAARVAVRALEELLGHST